MPESLPDECRGEQRLSQAEKRHRVHPVPEMQKGMPREGVEMKTEFQGCLSQRITRVGFVVPVSFSSMQVSPVGLKPHFSITRPEAGLS